MEEKNRTELKRSGKKRKRKIGQNEREVGRNGRGK